MTVHGAHPSITASGTAGGEQAISRRYGSDDHARVWSLIRAVAAAQDRCSADPAEAYPLIEAGEFEVTMETGTRFRLPWVVILSEAWLNSRPDQRAALQEDFLNLVPNTPAIPPGTPLILASSLPRAPSPVRAWHLLRMIADSGVGRPSTYDGIIENLTAKNLAILQEGQRLELTPLGRATVNLLRRAGERGIVVLDEAFNAELERNLAAVAVGEKTAADVVIKAIHSIVEAPLNVSWIDAIGFAGETAVEHARRLAGARAASGPSTADPDLPDALNPELALPTASPLRELRLKLEHQLETGVADWTERSRAVRSAFRLIALARDTQSDPAALLVRVRFDTLLRWLVGLKSRDEMISVDLATQVAESWPSHGWQKVPWPASFELTYGRRV